MTWANIATGDTIIAADTRGSFADKSVEIIADTAGGATVTFLGSNSSATILRGLNDPQGTAISVTASAFEAVLENARYIAPGISGGTGDDWTVHCLLRGILQKN